MTTQAIIYLSGMPFAFFAGLVVGEIERRTSCDPVDREEALVPVLWSLAAALFWPLVVAFVMFFCVGLFLEAGARRFVDRLERWIEK